MGDKSNSNLGRVIAGGYCIGCGACAVRDNRIALRDTTYGMPEATLVEGSLGNEVCPFASARSEDDISKELFQTSDHYDVRVGHYINNYVGYVRDTEARLNSSSGGVVSWVLLKLLKLKKIDGVIHVGCPDGEGYKYVISETAEDISRNAKSRYYPVSFNDALNSVLDNGKRYAFVGTPCFVKAMRLLSTEDVRVSASVKYCISIFCGHMKTKAFSEMIALQQGVLPSSLERVDFRVKNVSAPASRYSTQVHFSDNNGASSKLDPIPASNLYGMDWGLGYFKPLACDWCDDIAGEVADLSCGDAWLPEVVNDPLGTNILITRNKLIDDLIMVGKSTGELSISAVGVEKVYESQAGNYRHRRDGLSVRMSDAERQGIWTPTKRIYSDDFDVSARRKAIYRVRRLIAIRSHTAFEKAKTKGTFLSFMLRMLPYEAIYILLNGNILRGTAKILIQYWNLFNFRR